MWSWGQGPIEVEGVKAGLKLKPNGGKDGEVVMVQAMPMPHGESLTGPKAAFEPRVGPDEHHIALILPDGK